MKLYWKLFYEEFPNDKLIGQNSIPLREYKGDFIDGPIIDIGCGQSPILLEFSNLGRDIYAVDNDQLQIDYLKKRVHHLGTSDIQKWHFLKLEFPKEEIPKQRYALMIFSNLFHFYTLQQCKEIGNKILNYLAKGALVYISVHSHKFYKNNTSDPERFNYFKHYFTPKDLSLVFPSQHFERIFFADIEKEDSIEDRNFVNKWLEQYFISEKIKDQSTIDLMKKNYLSNKSQSDLIVIFRKK